MNLLELCEAETAPGGVPDWVLGCFQRRSITFFCGETDSSTLVLWLQSRGLTGDLRLAVDRPKVASLEELLTRSPDELRCLAEVEGGMAPSQFDARESGAAGPLAGVMRWGAWEAFQLHAKWPEPGDLRRVGDCLIEFAPSGAYVEDWRLLAGEPGPLIGLSLLEERDRESGRVLHRGGGLIIAGSHALFVRGRAAELPRVDRISRLIEQADHTLLTTVFSFDASYACRGSDGHWPVAASTLPWREGQPLLSLDGFSRAAPGFMQQHTEEYGRALERHFRVDTLEAEFVPAAATSATSGAREWLSAEASTLLRKSRR
jgi:hypothetical protein